MRAVRQKDTAPEMAVRRLLHNLGFRYRLHDRQLPGTPDIVFKGRRKVIFVHGCYWHGHNCKVGGPAKSRTEYWGPKIARNRQRDENAVSALSQQGWESMVVWECETKDLQTLAVALSRFLEPPLS
jgi:DNA mismatch endonuclease (patch repair protein)